MWKKFLPSRKGSKRKKKSILSSRVNGEKAARGRQLVLLPIVVQNPRAKGQKVEEREAKSRGMFAVSKMDLWRDPTLVRQEFSCGWEIPVRTEVMGASKVEEMLVCSLGVSLMWPGAGSPAGGSGRPLGIWTERGVL